jgi:hypothetical protein
MLRLVRGKALELLSEFFENVQEGKHVEKHVNLSIFGGLFGMPPPTRLHCSVANFHLQRKNTSNCMGSIFGAK